MEITWYGQSCFRLRGRGKSVITDPYGSDCGLKLPRMSAAIVTISHDHPEHNYAKGVRTPDYVISGPGEYEVADIFVIGVDTSLGGKGEGDRGRNTAYLIELEDLTVCHLGHMSTVPTQAQVEQLDSVDVLMIPVGGRSTLTAARAAEVVNLLEPSVVIPMHYKVPGLTSNFDTVTRFLKEMAVEKPEEIDTYRATKGQLPETTEVVLLEAKQ